jgi:AcrR family transcriptional regulator
MRSRREDLLNTAMRVFYEEGFASAGVDRIAEVSGVTKRTLYKHFRTKDELILAVLRRRDEVFRNWLLRAVERRGASPRERLLLIFDVLDDWYQTHGWHGCMFLNALAEVGRSNRAITAAVAEHKLMMREHLRELAAEAGCGNPDSVSEALFLLTEGAVAVAAVEGDPSAIRRAGELAASLLEGTLPPA